MKKVFAALALCAVLGCSPSGQSDAVRISDLVMPPTQHPELSVLELVLAIDDVANPPAGVPQSIAQALMDLDVVSAANATYTWGDPDGFVLIDLNVHRFATADAARNNVLANVDGIESIDGIGDAATVFGNQSVSFSVDATKVTVTTFSADIDIRSVAETYADWLAAD